jgi:hypothetical protein
MWPEFATTTWGIMAKGTKTRGKGGRPKLRAPERRRNILRFRATDQLQAGLAAAAENAGRSVSEEIETRLVRSFDALPNVEHAFAFAYGGPLAGILLMCARSMSLAGRAAFFQAAGEITDQAWLEDDYSLDQAIQAAQCILEAVRPELSATPHGASEDVGKRLAEDALRAATGTGDPEAGWSPTNIDETRAKTIRDMLGPVAKRMASRRAVLVDAPEADVAEPGALSGLIARAVRLTGENAQLFAMPRPTTVDEAREQINRQLASIDEVRAVLHELLGRMEREGPDQAQAVAALRKVGGQ